jgi:uncharacterized OB-fold protein/uncharacterized membrane protein YeaQ/YmgE (transglycosylase-associated protein family)
MLMVRCKCGKAVKVPAKFAGKAVKCPGCGDAVRIPAAVAAGSAPGAGTSRPRGTASGADPAVNALLDEVDLGKSRTGRRCPECRHDLEPNDVLCVKCGYNTETGKKIKTKKVQKIESISGVPVGPVKSKSKEDAPPAVNALAKLLNQVGSLLLLITILFTAYRAYAAMQAEPDRGVDALVSNLTESGIYLIGAGLLFGVVPYAVAANLVQNGVPAGRILSLVLGIVGAPLLLGILIFRLAMSDEVSRYCRA